MRCGSAKACCQTLSTLQASDATKLHPRRYNQLNERRSARKLDRSHNKRQAQAIVAFVAL